MIIYKDIITDFELFSDSYTCKLDKGVYEVEAKWKVVSDDFDDSLIGANASAEGGDEGIIKTEERVINIVHDYKLESFELDKKGFKKAVSTYAKKVVEKMTANEAPAEDIATFKECMKCKVAEILANFDDYQFFHSIDDYECVGMNPLLTYKDGDVEKPVFYFFAGGLVKEKC